MSRFNLRRDRAGFGWWDRDGDVFYERGAPMTDGGTAWIVWIEVRDDEIEHDGLYHGLRASGTTPVRRFRRGYGTEIVVDRAPSPTTRGAAWFAHLADAGSLEEATGTALRIVRDRRISRETSRRGNDNGLS